MTTLQKEQLYNKWNSCGRDTRIELTCKYLKILRSGEPQTTWLQFLANHLA